MSETRKRYNVGVRKLPYEQRDVAHRVLTEEDPRGFLNIIGADVDHEVAIGEDATYSVELTDAEAEEFRAASNCRYVEADATLAPDLGGTPIPQAATLAWMETTFAGSTAWTGLDVAIAVVDSGTTQAVRDYMGWTLLGRQAFGPNPATNDPPREVWLDGIIHGCLVAPCAVPMGGRFYDLLIADNNGRGVTSAIAAAFRWAADEGCKIVNLSYSSPTPQQAIRDAQAYMAARDVQLFTSAGNDGSTTIPYPAADCAGYANVHAVIAFDETTGLRRSTSNHAAFLTGSAPGTNVLGLTRLGEVTTWSGTSAASPHAARLCAQGATGGTFTPKRVAQALRANTRNTGQPPSEQGGGAFSLQRALASLTSSTNLAQTGTSTDAFDVTVFTTQPWSVISWVGADRTPVAGGTPTYRSNASATAERRTTAVNYWAAQQSAPVPGPNQVGMSSPLGQKWSLLAVELKPYTT